MLYKFLIAFVLSTLGILFASTSVMAETVNEVLTPSPNTCIDSKFSRPSYWNTTLTLTNHCDSAVDLQNASIQFNTNDIVHSVWGNFSNLAYPNQIQVSSTKSELNHYLTVIGLVFPTGNEWWHPNSKLSVGDAIQLKYSAGTIDYDPNSVKIYANDTATKTGIIDLSNATTKPEGSTSDPIIDIINAQTHQLVKHVSLPWKNEGLLEVVVDVPAGTYQISPESYFVGTSQYQGAANPNSVIVANGQTVVSEVSYNALPKEGQIRITVTEPKELKDTGYRKEPTVILINQSTKSQVQKSIRWSAESVVSNLNYGVKYQLSTPDIIYANNHCVATFTENPVQAGSSSNPANTKLMYVCSAVQNINVKVHVDGLKGSSKQSEIVTITFTPNDDFPVVTQDVQLNNGTGSASTLLIDGKYGVVYNVSIASDISGYTPSFSVNPISPSVSQNGENVYYSKISPTTVLFSPYKDTGINMNWNSYVISTKVNHLENTMPLLGDDSNPSQLLPGNNAMTLAFATGSCGSESWGGVPGSKLAQANIPLFVKNNINYIISTGGANGAFQCNSSSEMQNFINRYNSKNMVGIDFDIEGGYNQTQLDSLMLAAAVVQKNNPSLHVSLTLATLAQPNDTVNNLGKQAIQSAVKAGLNFDVNLMVMDYGNYGCQKNTSGQCDMTASAIFAAKEFSRMYGIPLSRIELTPMIGENDTAGEITSTADIEKIAQFVKDNHLASLHYWSFDRDTSCQAAGTLGVSPTCNNVSTGPLQYDAAILKRLES